MGTKSKSFTEIDSNTERAHEKSAHSRTNIKDQERTADAQLEKPGAAGNLAVQRRLRSDSAELNVSNPEDEHEREASKISEHVSNASESPVQISPVKQSGEHAQTGDHRVALPTDGGRPLDGATRSSMESKFGRDFGDVRIHTGPEASELANTLEARAYTSGNDIVFGEGEHAPETSEGQKLIAHELAHVVQRRPGISRQPAQPAPQTPAAQTPAQTTPAAPAPPACTATKTPTQALTDHNAKAQTLFRMEYFINVATQKTPTKFSTSLLSRADAAIQAEYGSQITRKPTYAQAFAKPTTEASVTAITPDAFAKMRIPDEATAREFLGQLAMRFVPQAMTEGCITSPTDPAIVSLVADPILKEKGLSYVRDYMKIAEGGRTTFSDIDAPKSGVKAVFQTEARNLGHIIVHEAMHYYMSDAFRVEARKRKDHLDLVEGGAEFFARNVISNQLAGDADFTVGDSTYAHHVTYIAAFTVMQRLWFPAMFFQGRTDLLANIAPPP